jgi:hypothetical protein
MSITNQLTPVGDVDVFYRESGPANAPSIALLRGFPTPSHAAGLCNRCCCWK